MTLVASMTEYGTLPALRIAAPDGAQAIVTLYGAHLVSWKTADGRERLFCSSKSALDGSNPIRGGVPVIFPQFSTRGNGMRHGFARISTWRLTDSGQDDDGTFAELSLSHGDVAASVAAAWPFQFELRLRFSLQRDKLSMTFTVRNTGADAFPFSAALHTYFALADLAQLGIGGLHNVRFSDHTGNSALQETSVLRITEKIDRIYYQIPGAITLDQGAAGGGRPLRLEESGFTDAVVWNPGAADAAALADMADDEYTGFVCVEAALIEPDLLAAGAEWVGRHAIYC